MRNLIRLSSILLAMLATAAPFAPAQSDWKAKFGAELPLLGHRNWILIADSAYPLQVSPGMEVVETDADQLEVVRYVLAHIDRSIHVRPEIFLDAELPFVPDTDAPGASDYRSSLAAVLRGYTTQSELHEKLIAQLGEAGQSFHVLVLKTNLTIPYSSVFIRLNCKYWPSDAEERLRARMASEPAH
jgi:hypothetical protein